MKDVTGEKVESMNCEVSWTRMGIQGVTKKVCGEGKGALLNKLRSELEKLNGVKLAAAPRWLVREDMHLPMAELQAVGLMLSRTSERIRLTTEGVKHGTITKEARLFDPSRDKARKQCTNCCRYGHLWH